VLLAQTKFVFPFRIEIDAAFPFRHDGRLASVQIRTAPAEQQLRIRRGDAPRTEKRVKIKATHVEQDKRVEAREITFTNEPELFVESVSDYLSVTFFDVNFEIAAAPSADDQAALGAVFARGFAIARRFIQAYRSLTNETDVFVPSPSDTFAAELWLADDYIFNEDVVEGSFRSAGRHVTWHLPTKTGLTKPKPDAARIAALASALRTSTDIPVYVELLQEAQEQYVHHEDYRLAVVLLISAFEHFLQERLLREVDFRRIMLLPARKKAPSSVPVREAILNGRVRDELLGLYTAMLSGTKILQSAEYSAWFREAYEVRNGLIHRGKISVDRAVADKAFAANWAFIQFIDKLLYASRPKAA
jgi:hypothetical protein